LKITLFKSDKIFKEFNFNNKYIKNIENIVNSNRYEDDINCYNIIIGPYSKEEDRKTYKEINKLYNYVYNNNNKFNKISFYKDKDFIEIDENKIKLDYSIKVKYDNEFNIFNIWVFYKRS